MELTIIPNYQGLMKKVYDFLEKHAVEDEDIFVESGESRSGYMSRCKGAVGYKYLIDFSAYYFNEYKSLPSSEAKKDISRMVRQWVKELKERSREEEKTIDELEHSFFDDSSKYGLVHLNVMIKDISSGDGITLKEQEKYKDYDNIILISCYTSDQYGQYSKDICKEYLLPIKLNFDINKVWVKIEKELDKRIKILKKYYDQR